MCSSDLLALFQPWHISVPQAIELAREIEAASFAVSPQIANSDIFRQCAILESRLLKSLNERSELCIPFVSEFAKRIFLLPDFQGGLS